VPIPAKFLRGAGKAQGRVASHGQIDGCIGPKASAASGFLPYPRTGFGLRLGGEQGKRPRAGIAPEQGPLRPAQNFSAGNIQERGHRRTAARQIDAIDEHGHAWLDRGIRRRADPADVQLHG